MEKRKGATQFYDIAACNDMKSKKLLHIFISYLDYGSLIYHFDYFIKIEEFSVSFLL